MRSFILSFLLLFICLICATADMSGQTKRRFANPESNSDQTESTTSPNTGESIPTQRDSRNGRTARIIVQIIGAGLEIYCNETSKCPAYMGGGRNQSTQTAPIYPNKTSPQTRSESTSTAPVFPFNSTQSSQQTNRSPQPANLSFGFSQPQGWNTFTSGESKTIAPNGEYYNGNLRNGLIVGVKTIAFNTFQNSSSLYLNQLLSTNTYLRQSGSAQSAYLNSYSCLKYQLAGYSPISNSTEYVSVQNCQINSTTMLYIVNVSSGQNMNYYRQMNDQLIQSIQFK